MAGCQSMSDSKLLNYLPSLFHEIKEMQVIMDVENSQLDQLQADINRYLDDQFVLLASEEALRQREAELGIQPDRRTETIDFRRKRIINRYSMKVPFTERYLQERIDFLFGIGRGKVEVDVQNFLLRLNGNLEDPTLFREAERTVQLIKPANLVYHAVPWVRETITIQDRVTVNLKRFLILGGFQLGDTFLISENEVEL